MFSAALIAGIVCVTISLFFLPAPGPFLAIPLPAPGVIPPSHGVILSGAAPGFGAAESKDPYTRLGAHRTIAAIIPARNEADVIGRAVSSLLRQRGPTLSP